MSLSSALLLHSSLEAWSSHTMWLCKMLAHTDGKDQQVTMIAHAPDSGRNLYRLFHVLWRCVSEMENVLVTLPGVPLNRCMTVKKGVHSRIGQ